MLKQSIKWIDPWTLFISSKETDFTWDRAWDVLPMNPGVAYLGAYPCHFLGDFVNFKRFSHITLFDLYYNLERKASQCKALKMESQGSCHLATFTQPTSGIPKTSLLVPSHPIPHTGRKPRGNKTSTGCLYKDSGIVLLGNYVANTNEELPGNHI